VAGLVLAGGAADVQFADEFDVLAGPGQVAAGLAMLVVMGGAVLRVVVDAYLGLNSGGGIGGRARNAAHGERQDGGHGDRPSTVSH
jgi:hypothetical protein